MANPDKGEVAFSAGGKDYILRFSANAICELEEHLDRGIVDIAAEIQSWGPPLGRDGKRVEEPVEVTAERVKRIRVSLVRSIFWAGLRDHHADLDLRAAGDLLVEAGGINGALPLIGEAFARAFPAEKGGAARPPRGPQRPRAGKAS